MANFCLNLTCIPSTLLSIYSYSLFTDSLPYASQWSCTLGSITSLGADCNVTLKGSNTSTLVIPPNSLDVKKVYNFVVLVSAKDGRSSSQTVVVTPVDKGSAQLQILSTFVQFNPGSKLVVDSNIFAQFDVIAFWNISSSLDNSVSFSSSTPSKQTFTKYDAAKNIHFPLSVPAYALRGGISYTFRLTVYPSGKVSLATFSEVVLRANSPPSGGYLAIQPRSGFALVTNFSISSPGFTADISSFPLSYTFTYRVSQNSANLTIASASTRAFTVSALPAGFPDLHNLITVSSQASDIFLSSTSVFQNVTVNVSPTANVSLILKTGLTQAFSSGNVNLAFQIVNIVSPHRFCRLCEQMKWHCMLSNSYLFLTRWRQP
jgi:REJ domain